MKNTEPGYPMKRQTPYAAACTLFLCCAMLAACAGAQKPEPDMFDLGLARPAAAAPALPPLALAEVDAPEWLDTSAIHYRLAYASELQPRRYANSHWSMPPAQLFTQRLKARIGQSGGVLLTASDGAAGVPVLRLEVDDFSQIFASAERSEGLVAARLSVLDGRRLLGQRSFTRRMPAPTADAAGGVAALAQASDAVIGDLLQWLATQPMKP
jgi:cholesterol transport system auxiliary component